MRLSWYQHYHQMVVHNSAISSLCTAALHSLNEGQFRLSHLVDLVSLAFILSARSGSVLEQGAIAPKCDMKRCLTNSKYWHIGAKWSVLLLSKCVCGWGSAPDPAGSSRGSPYFLIGWGGDKITLPIPHPTLHIDSPTFTCLSLVGAVPPNIVV